MDAGLWLSEHYLFIEEVCALQGFETCWCLCWVGAWVRLCGVYTHSENVGAFNFSAVVLFTANDQQHVATQIPLWGAHVCSGTHLARLKPKMFLNNPNGHIYSSLLSVLSNISLRSIIVTISIV